MDRWRLLRALLLVVGVVLSPLRAVATVPTIMAYDVAVRSTATTAPRKRDAVQPEAESARTGCDDATFAYDDSSNRPTAAGIRGILPYDDARNLGERREVGAGAIYDAPIATTAAEGAEALAPRASSLFHYTTEEGLNGILESGELNPSLKALNPADARYGNGQYLTDIIPGTRSPGSLSSTFLSVPGQGARFSNFVEIDTTGLNVIEGRPGVFIVPGEGPLDISGRIMSFGQSY